MYKAWEELKASGVIEERKYIHYGKGTWGVATLVKKYSHQH
jgi:hypothetical protein